MREPLASQDQELALVDAATSDLWLDADPVRLVQVVENLLQNASKFTAAAARSSSTAGGRATAGS